MKKFEQEEIEVHVYSQFDLLPTWAKWFVVMVTAAPVLVLVYMELCR